jgi:uncharacterized protein YqeY
MSLHERLNSDILNAMRGHDKVKLEALRYLKSQIQLIEKAQGKQLDDSSMEATIAKQAKDRRESIKMFEDGNRADLAAKESAELTVLEEYLPTQMNHDNLTQMIRDTIVEVEAKTIHDKGRVMARIMPQIRGRADGAVVDELVNQLLQPRA